MKVLEIIDGETFGGITKLMLDIRNNIKDIDISFLTHVPLYDKNIKNSYTLNISRKTLKGKIIYNHRLRKFLKVNKYDIVHINSAVFLYSFQVVIICKICGVKKIVVHSHNTPHISKLRKLIIKILNPLYRKLTNVHLTCSTEATKSLFTKNDDVIMLKNGVDIEKYKYNEKVREEYRKKLNLDKKIVYGHVGRFHPQKNHEFLIDLFYEISLKQDNSILLLVGDGELIDRIKNKVKELKLEDKVLFLGFREDIDKLMNAIDYFLFPSLYEGLGIVTIEAQTSGLLTFVSKEIPEDANITSNFYRIDSFDKKEWTKKILNTKIKSRKNTYKEVIKKGYDIKDTSRKLEKIYKDLIK